MIVPWLQGFLSWSRAPLTWTLIAVNFFIYLITYQPEDFSAAAAFTKQSTVSMTGHLYLQFLDSADKNDERELVILGMQALRNPQFMQKAESFKFQGDQIAIQQWRKDFVDFRDSLEGRVSRIFGLSFDKHAPLTWITYQFMHAGLVHLLSNMLLLLIFAAAVEQKIGGFAMLALYILSGFGGGLGFFTLGQSSIAPMIGASGSLSGIMAFYAFYEKKKRVRFFYFLSPFESYYGFLYLPTWMIYPLCFFIGSGGLCFHRPWCRATAADRRCLSRRGGRPPG
jgi:membrane associated rhomboid family serine protease